MINGAILDCDWCIGKCLIKMDELVICTDFSHYQYYNID